MSYADAIVAVVALIVAIREFYNGKQVGSLQKDKLAMNDKINSLKNLTVAMGKNYEIQNRSSTFLGQLARAHSPDDINKLCSQFYDLDSTTGEPTSSALQSSDRAKTFPPTPRK